MKLESVSFELKSREAGKSPMLTPNLDRYFKEGHAWITSNPSSRNIHKATLYSTIPVCGTTSEEALESPSYHFEVWAVENPFAENEIPNVSGRKSRMISNLPLRFHFLPEVKSPMKEWQGSVVILVRLDSDGSYMDFTFDGHGKGKAMEAQIEYFREKLDIPPHIHIPDWKHLDSADEDEYGDSLSEPESLDSESSGSGSSDEDDGWTRPVW